MNDGQTLNSLFCIVCKVLRIRTDSSLEQYSLNIRKLVRIVSSKRKSNIRRTQSDSAGLQNAYDSKGT